MGEFKLVWGGGKGDENGNDFISGGSCDAFR